MVRDTLRSPFPWCSLATMSSNAHFRTLAESVKRGVWEAGGFPLEFPVLSTGETLMRPTAMLYRNLLAMDVEESIRANPIDGVILLAGCGTFLSVCAVTFFRVLIFLRFRQNNAGSFDGGGLCRSAYVASVRWAYAKR